MSSQAVRSWRSSDPRSLFLAFAAMMLVQIILHLPFLDKPPMGQHVWRQVVGHAMARNYHTEDASFFNPRNDIRITDAHDGRIWHEFPLVYWIIGQSYGLTGFQDINARLIWLLFSLGAIPASYFFLRGLSASHGLSLLFSYSLTFVPYFFYYSITLVPNLLALVWFMAGTALLYKPIEVHRFNLSFFLGISALSIATISKPTYLFFGLPIAYLFWRQWRATRSMTTLIQASLGGTLVALTNFLIIKHAQKLYALAPPEQQIHTPIGPAEKPENLAHIWDNVSTAMTAWFGEMFIGFAAIPLFLVGVIAVARRLESFPTPYFWRLWSLSFLIFGCLFVVRLADHDYYITSLLPVSAIGIALGARRLLSLARFRKVAVVLLALMPIVMVGRTYKRWSTNAQVPKELLEDPAAISTLIPAGQRVLILGDRSPIVFLYYLQRKGVAEGNSVSTQRLQVLKEAGISWLIAYLPRADLTSIQDELIEHGRIGGFAAYEITGGSR